MVVQIAGDNIGSMKRHNPHPVSELVTGPAEIVEFDALREQSARNIYAAPGLSAHVRQLRNRNQGISRWLVLAIFAGAVVALMMVQFAIH
jgi:hypothetical protein